MSAMQMKVSKRGGISVVSMSGDLEIQEIDYFKKAVDKVLAAGDRPRAVLDLSGVTRMTSYVVALVGFYNAQFKQADGKFVVAGASAPAQRAFELSGLDKVVSLYASADEAVKAVKG